MIEENVRIIVERLTEDYGRFAIEPLERGYGWTIGNALRRILLSSIEGAAITSVKIDGVRHELEVLPGLKEDVLEVLINLKKLVVKIEDNNSHILELDVKGPKVIKAGDFFVPANVKIINPDLTIATLVDESNFHMEVEVRKGKGYVTTEENKELNQPIGVLVLDSIFSPVKKVSYEVEKTRVGRRTDLDKLIIDIWTNGAISPEEVFREASKILMEYFKLLYEKEFQLPYEEKAEEIPIIEETQKGLSLEELGLSTRAYNSLRHAGIHTIDDLLLKTKDELMRIKNFGQKSLQELEEKLKEKGLRLRDGNSDSEKGENLE
ncbi:MAG: DNA-directed RNA polymerase subunit alpha [Dictyoglomaceae bacterium]|nr:DNA-directed RNA polymerase subunit alpha [Dictyoglomaceae bacterium]HPU43217.1 DNA-directed RNA polymerase subunit alpha [Dictyoglomaceae bacterium]